MRSFQPEASRQWLPRVLSAELDFYSSYRWCLNPCPTVRAAIVLLRCELNKLDEALEQWQRSEVMTNIYLFSCAIISYVDDYLRGSSISLPRLLPLSGLIANAAEKAVELLRSFHLQRIRKWKQQWQSCFDEFLRLFVSDTKPDQALISSCKARLLAQLAQELPRSLTGKRIRLPSAFRGQDLTHFDILKLADKFITAMPDRKQSILILGLRTAGSYFAPLLVAYLRAASYERIAYMTIRPDKGIGLAERAQLVSSARRGDIAVIVDDPPGTGGTIASAIETACKSGFTLNRIFALFPIHPANRVLGDAESLLLSKTQLLTLEPDGWHKHQLLEPKRVENRLREYFHQYLSVRVVASHTADQFNAHLRSLSEENRRTRLKRVYEVRLEDRSGLVETRYVLAKSVGWGWFGYHAFIAGYDLSGFVPALLGLRDGILYVEWLPQSSRIASGDHEKKRTIAQVASYVAARARLLQLDEDPTPELSSDDGHRGYSMLADHLSRAYGWSVAAKLKQARIRYELSRRPCPLPTLIDGRMRRAEWINGTGSLLKTDFEHHGMGKNELNLIDPAYDLAEAILHLNLSQSEEDELIARYIEESGDEDVKSRLFLSKLIAGIWAKETALANLHHPRLSHRQEEFSCRYIEAHKFLTLQAARFCGKLCGEPRVISWGSPLVVLDLDGVLDRQVFGFPCTTAAGIEAIHLLHAHGLAVAVDTARTIHEVKAYCEAYGFAGGIAEYGSYVWDAVQGRGRVLVSAEAMCQIERLREALRQIPGIFLDDGCLYSIRAFTYERKGTEPVPSLMIRSLMERLKLDRLTFQQNSTDTAIIESGIDKGKGLVALLEMCGLQRAETIAIGDSESDLAMFQVADRSFAPSQIWCKQQAIRLGCKITDRPYQLGLLKIVRSLVHADGARCERCQACRAKGNDLFSSLLKVADQNHFLLLLRAMLDRKAIRYFVR
jgi:hydroxymethylpyrimidine pyrophosphatase-like HAD family hydrolase/orotate phosphoribosyltransferase